MRVGSAHSSEVQTHRTSAVSPLWCKHIHITYGSGGELSQSDALLVSDEVTQLVMVDMGFEAQYPYILCLFYSLEISWISGTNLCVKLIRSP